MTKQNKNADAWQVEVDGQIYEAGFDELPEWISEGALQPTDKIKRGNLRWIEAGKVPVLVSMFDAPRNKSSQSDRTKVDRFVANVSVRAQRAARPEKLTAIELPLDTADGKDLCLLHPSQSAIFVCKGCEGSFCKTCPKSFGGSVKICPACGGLCERLDERQKALRNTTMREAAAREGFGLRDFGRAISLPFRFKASLAFGAAIFAVFTVGQAAGALGGVYLAAASLLCFLLANTVSFGLLTNTLGRFASGRIAENFFPAFEEFSVWDDIVRPFVLSVGVYIASFGFLITGILIASFLISQAQSERLAVIKEQIEKIPGTQYYTANDPVRQSDQVRKVLAESRRQSAERLELANNIAAGNTGRPEDIAELTPPAAVATPAELATASRTRDFGELDLYRAVTELPAVLMVMCAIAAAWGMFFFPAACIVAGYSKSFRSTVNLWMGLDTIKRLGLTYFKIMVMTILLGTAGVAAWIIIRVALRPFDLPVMGNIPALFIISMFEFYLIAVFSCMLGLALFKSANKLRVAD